MGKPKGKQRRISQNLQARRTLRRLKSKKRGRPAKTHQEFNPMSRSKDLAFIENQIVSLRTEIQELQKKYQAYHEDIAQQIRGVLEEAEVFHKVQALEAERTGARDLAQKHANQLQAQIAQLHASQNFLLSREQADPEPAATEPELEGSAGKVMSEMEVIQTQVDKQRARSV